MRLALAWLFLTAMMADARAQEEPSPDAPSPDAPSLDAPPPFAPLRYDEDYSYLRDPSARTGNLLSIEPIKFISLSPSGAFYVSIGGEIREQYEFYHHPNFGLSPEDKGGYLLGRYLLHGDLQLGAPFRIFGQLRGAYASFRDGPRVPANEDGFDIQQAFFDLRGGPWPNGSQALTLRVGRQEMRYGSERLISVREATNVRRAFDAVRALATLQTWRMDGFYSRPVETVPYSFDDWVVSSTEFWGVYTTGPIGLVPRMKVDFYYLGLKRADATFNLGTAREIRHTIGTRLFGEAGALAYNFEGIYQWGTFEPATIFAWALGSDTGYTVAKAPTKPRIALQADLISGDRELGDDKLGTFNPLFPRGNYFGESATLGPVNLFDVHPVVQLHFSKAVSLGAEWGFFWRYSENDGIYDNALNLIQAADNSDRRYIGSELSARIDWRIGRHVNVNASYSHFFSGAFMKDTGPGQDINFASLLVAYRF